MYFEVFFHLVVGNNFESSFMKVAFGYSWKAVACHFTLASK